MKHKGRVIVRQEKERRLFQQCQKYFFNKLKPSWLFLSGVLAWMVVMQILSSPQSPSWLQVRIPYPWLLQFQSKSYSHSSSSSTKFCSSQDNSVVSLFSFTIYFARHPNSSERQDWFKRYTATWQYTGQVLQKAKGQSAICHEVQQSPVRNACILYSVNQKLPLSPQMRSACQTQNSLDSSVWPKGSSQKQHREWPGSWEGPRRKND